MAYPLGFRYAAAYAGIRKMAKDDLALIVSDTPASAAAVFTQNRVVAAPVEVGIIDSPAARARRKSLCGKSSNCWSFVYE